MNLTDFQQLLAEQSKQSGGVFNWLVSEQTMSKYGQLSTSDQWAFLKQIYTEHFNDVAQSCEGMTAFERVMVAPIISQPIFELIVCAHLIKLKQDKQIFTCSAGECLALADRPTLELLNARFHILQATVKTMPVEQWVKDCITNCGVEALPSWIEWQCSFLSSKILSLTNAGSKALPRRKEDSKATDSKKRSLPNHIIDFSRVTMDAAQNELNQLIGLSGVRNSIHNIIAGIIYGNARSVACGVPTQRTFNNIIISGAPGVGKTTSARIIAQVLAASGALKEKIATLTTTSALIGRYIGDTEHNMRELFSDARGGVIIIDEADTLAARHGSNETRFHEAAIDTLNAMIGYAKDADSGTIVVLTGYETGLNNLMTKNEGLRRRFPHRISIPDYDAGALEGILINILKTRAYKFDDEIVRASARELTAAKEYMGVQFGNAGTIEEFVNVWEAGRAKKIGIDTLRAVVPGKNFSSNFVEQLSTLSLGEIPRFDKITKSFVVSSLSLVPHSPMVAGEESDHAR